MDDRSIFKYGRITGETQVALAIAEIPVIGSHDGCVSVVRRRESADPPWRTMKETIVERLGKMEAEIW
jgi:hypothetical protein